MSLLIKNIGELFDGEKIIRNTCIYIENGEIVSIGREEKAEEIIDAEGNFVMPGFVDSHTHAIFSGSREFELPWKIEGLSYYEIAERGGGIWYTVKETRRASKEKLRRETEKKINEMLMHGTTTVEIKSGYGLDKENEIKLLEVINDIKKDCIVDIIPTFLAHAVPEDMDAESYTEYIINEIIPEIGSKNLAKFCDVFCEKGYFDIKQSRRILEEGKKHGMLPKIHADEFSCIGCSKLAVEINATSADHLLMAGKEEIKELAKSNVIATLLPATPFVLNTSYPNAREMINAGVTVALATDFNPNCYVQNMQFIVQLACYKLKMSPIEALKASTFNSAKALALKNVGAIKEGYKADVIITNVASHLFIPYKIGINLVKTVIKNGKVVVENGKRARGDLNPRPTG